MKQPEQYKNFAELYDLFMDDVDYDAWAEYVYDLTGRPSSIAECGCGTGEITLRLKKKGCSIIGMDKSPEMLETASKKARDAGLRIPFVCQDMCALKLHRPVDAVISCCDCVNYLTDEKSVREFFKSAYDALKPSGILAFDISSEYKLKNILGSNIFADSREEAAYIWKNSYCETSGLIEMEIEFFRYIQEHSDSGLPLFVRFDEFHIQRAHSESEIFTWLNEAGFENVKVYEAFTHSPAGKNTQRLQFTACKGKEHE